jgi:Spy/CpxP family protein refolding chaperone
MAGGLASAQGPDGPGTGPGFGQHRPPIEGAFGFANGQFWNNPNLMQQLSLTDDQRKAMDGILQDHRMKLIDLRANLQRAEVELGPMLKADTPDQKAIEAQIDKVVMARADLEKANARFLLDIRMQLKPEQWKQLQTLRMNRMQRDRMREHGRGAWGRDGQRPGMGGKFRGQGVQPPANVPLPDAPITTPPPPPSGSGDAQ